MTGTYLEELITQPVPGLDIDPTARDRDWFDCTGFYSTACGTPSPRGVTGSGPPGRLRGIWTCRSPGATTTKSTVSIGANDLMPESNLDYELVGRELLRPRRQLGDHGEDCGHARHQQRAGRQSDAQRRGWHHGQRQHLPADLRRPRSLRLPAGDGGLLKRTVRQKVPFELRRRSFGTAAFFSAHGAAANPLRQEPLRAACGRQACVYGSAIRLAPAPALRNRGHRRAGRGIEGRRAGTPSRRPRSRR